VTIDTNLNYVPELAESWEILENGKVYVFHRRKGVKFHEGSDFDAEVVRWNHQRAVDPEENAFIAPFFSIVESVEAIDAHDWDQTLNFSGAVLDTFTASRLIDTRAGANTPNHQDLHVDALIDRVQEATTDEGYLKAGQELQRYVVAETMIYPSLTTLPFIQASRAYVKGYEQLHGFKIRFETMWLDR
jgi:ABC-type oligopeptide transport system substrate-binding subunit